MLLNPAFVMVLFHFTLLLNRGGAAGISHLAMALHMTAGCVAGGGLGVGLAYAVWAVNGGSFEDTVTKACGVKCCVCGLPCCCLRRAVLLADACIWGCARLLWGAAAVQHPLRQA